MSTKTTFKRIALVAVAALGLGVLSVAPSSALVSQFAVTVANGTSGLSSEGGASDSTTAATINVAALLENGNADTITVTAVQKSIPLTATTIRADLMYLDSSTPSVASSTRVDNSLVQASAFSSALDTVTAASGLFSISAGSATAATFVNANFGLQLDSVASTTRVAGTYTWTILVKAYVAGTLSTTLSSSQDVSITIAKSTSVATTPSAVTSFANLVSSGQAAGTAKSTDDAVISVVSTAGTAAGYVFIGNRNAANGSGSALDSLTATVTGAGVVCTTTGFNSPTVGTCGKSIKVAATGDYQFAIQADGTAGASSVSVVSGVLGTTYTKSVNFYTKAAKTITATAFTPVLTVGSNDSAVVVTAVDANGAAWAGTPYIYAATAADALIGR